MGSRRALADKAQVGTKCVQNAELCVAAVESIGDGVITTDVAGRICYLNAVASELIGWGREEAVGYSLGERVMLIDETTGERVGDPIIRCFAEGSAMRLGVSDVLVRRDGARVPIDVSVGPIRGSDKRIMGAILILRDVSAIRKILHNIAYQASHDALTRLVNRGEFERRLARVLSNTHGMQGHALLFMDMDRFKVVNDTCGHRAGDELLRQVAQVFLSIVRERDTLARFGGDEFALLLEHCPQEKALVIARELRSAVNKHTFCWEGRRFRLGMSIGIVPICGVSAGEGDVLAAADGACYAAKRQGGDGIHVAALSPE